MHLLQGGSSGSMRTSHIHQEDTQHYNDGDESTNMLHHQSTGVEGVEMRNM
jgi:hypothetical protein